MSCGSATKMSRCGFAPSSYAAISSHANCTPALDINTHPTLPLLPTTRINGVPDGAPLPHVHCHPPHHNQDIHHAQHPSEAPFPPPNPIPYPVQLRFNSVERKRAGDSPRLVREAFRLGICVGGDAVVVVLGHVGVREWTRS